MDAVNTTHLEAGTAEWENIPDAIRDAFLALVSTVTRQGSLVGALHNEVALLRRTVGGKCDKGALDDLDRASGDHESRLSVLAAEMADLRTDVELKADAAYLNDCLLTKANKSEARAPAVEERAGRRDQLRVEKGLDAVRSAVAEVTAQQQESERAAAQRQRAGEEQLGEVRRLCDSTQASIDRVHARVDGLVERCTAAEMAADQAKAQAAAAAREAAEALRQTAEAAAVCQQRERDMQQTLARCAEAADRAQGGAEEGRLCAVNAQREVASGLEAAQAALAEVRQAMSRVDRLSQGTAEASRGLQRSSEQFRLETEDFKRSVDDRLARFADGMRATDTALVECAEALSGAAGTDAIEELRRVCDGLAAGLQGKAEEQQVLEALATKVDVEQLAEELQAKANKESVAAALHRKANKAAVAEDVGALQQLVAAHEGQLLEQRWRSGGGAPPTEEQPQPQPPAPAAAAAAAGLGSQLSSVWQHSISNGLRQLRDDVIGLTERQATLARKADVDEALARVGDELRETQQAGHVTKQQLQELAVLQTSAEQRLTGLVRAAEERVELVRETQTAAYTAAAEAKHELHGELDARVGRVAAQVAEVQAALALKADEAGVQEAVARSAEELRSALERVAAEATATANAGDRCDSALVGQATALDQVAEAVTETRERLGRLEAGSHETLSVCKEEIRALDRAAQRQAGEIRRLNDVATRSAERLARVANQVEGKPDAHEVFDALQRSQELERTAMEQLREEKAARERQSAQEAQAQAQAQAQAEKEKEPHHHRHHRRHHRHHHRPDALPGWAIASPMGAPSPSPSPSVPAIPSVSLSVTTPAPAPVPMSAPASAPPSSRQGLSGTQEEQYQAAMDELDRKKAELRQQLHRRVYM